MKRSFMTASVMLALTFPSTHLTHSRGPQSTIVRAYEAFRDHDPQLAQKTEEALTRTAADCGSVTALFDPLRLDTSRAAAAALVRQVDEARIPEVIERAIARAATALRGGRMTVCVHEVERVKAPALTPDDVLVSEGKADYFACRLYPEQRPRHTIAKTPDDLAIAWREFPKYREMNRAAFRSAFMIAAPPSPLPLWAGYKLGFEIARQRLVQTNGRPETWAAIPAASMIERFRLPTR